MAQLVKNLPAVWETWVWSLGWEDTLEKGTATHSVFRPEEFHPLYNPRGGKESDTTERLSFHFRAVFNYNGSIFHHSNQIFLVKESKQRNSLISKSQVNASNVCYTSLAFISFRRDMLHGYIKSSTAGLPPCTTLGHYSQRICKQCPLEPGNTVTL